MVRLFDSCFNVQRKSVCCTKFISTIYRHVFFIKIAYSLFVSTPGFYCEAENITEPTGLCSPGYYCVLRAYTPQPDGLDATGGPCEQGTYCTEGSSYPAHCPKGTFGHVDKLPAESNCTDCWPGYYCMEVGLTEPNGTCYPGTGSFTFYNSNFPRV